MTLLSHKFVSFLRLLIGSAFCLMMSEYSFANNKKTESAPACNPALNERMSFTSANRSASETKLLLLKQGREILEAGHALAALSIADEILRHYPDDIDALKLKMGASYRLNNLGESFQIAQIILKRDPEYRIALGIMVKGYLRQKDFPKALEFAKKQLELDPRSLHAMGLLAQSYLGLEQYQNAFQVVKSQLRRDEKNLFALGLGAQAQMGLGSFSAAKSLALQQLEIDPQNKIALGLLTEIHLRMGDYAESLKIAEDKIRNNRKDFIGWNYKILALLGLKRFEEAQLAINFLASMDMNNPRIDVLQVKLLESRGEIDEAIKYCTRQLQNHPYDKKLQSLLRKLTQESESL